jgi:hypothetical protein
LDSRKEDASGAVMKIKKILHFQAAMPDLKLDQNGLDKKPYQELAYGRR